MFVFGFIILLTCSYEKAYFLLFVASTFLMACFTPSEVEVDVQYPNMVSKGEVFEVVVDIVNSSRNSQTLDSIDIGRAYLKGIIMTSSSPDYIESRGYDIFDFESFSYDLEIPSQETFSVVYTMQAFEEGDFGDLFDVCINSGGDCLNNTIRTVVVE